MTNPEARSFVWEQIKKSYIKYGIRTFWLDEAEPEIHPQQFGSLKTYAENMAQTALMYPYYYANGDIGSDFHALKESVVSGLSMAMCGIPWWNSDIGGFFNGDTGNDYFRELIVRW